MKFNWGVASKNSNGKWETVFINGLAIDVLDLDIHINDHGFTYESSIDMIKFEQRFREGMEKFNDKKEETD